MKFGTSEAFFEQMWVKLLVCHQEQWPFEMGEDDEPVDFDGSSSKAVAKFR